MPEKKLKKVDIAQGDGVLDLKGREKGQVGFQVRRIEEDEEVAVDEVDGRVAHQQADDLQKRMESFAEKLEKAVVKVSPGDEGRLDDGSVPRELIKVKFEKFVQLVASRDFWQVLEKNKDEELIMSSNLLTDLASANDEKGQKKTPVIFLVGLAIGVVITYILISS